MVKLSALIFLDQILYTSNRTCELYKSESEIKSTFGRKQLNILFMGTFIVTLIDLKCDVNKCLLFILTANPENHFILLQINDNVSVL